MAPDDSGYDKRADRELEARATDLMTAVIDLQNGTSRQDAEPLYWPADTYEPTNTKPADA